MGKEREAQIRGTTLGMVALALLAAVTAIMIAFAVGGQLRSVFPQASGSNGTPASVAALEPR